ncbi:MAG: hypothetical protein M3Y07_03490 [Acidobacteriota bacterium]|nr:hypothetical protein [Acidobacteriota bacterium]
MTDSQFGRFLELQTEAERQHIEFLKVEVQTGFTFMDVAGTELISGDLPHSKRALAGARAAFDVLLARLPGLRDAMTVEERRWFEERIKKIGGALKHFPD